MSEVLVLLLGACLGYATGWLQKVINDARRRKAVASALLAEQLRLHSTLEYLIREWRGQSPILALATPMHDQVPDVVDLFDPLTAGRLLDYWGFVIELRVIVDHLKTVVPDERARMAADVQELARNILLKEDLARQSLKAAGAVELAPAPLRSAVRG